MVSTATVLELSMLTRRQRFTLIAGTTAAAVTAGVMTAVVARAAVACRVDYTVTSQWSGGFGGSVTINNLGDPVDGWTLTWTFPAGQAVTQAWNADVTPGTPNVT